MAKKYRNRETLKTNNLDLVIESLLENKGPRYVYDSGDDASRSVRFADDVHLTRPVMLYQGKYKTELGLSIATYGHHELAQGLQALDGGWLMDHGGEEAEAYQTQVYAELAEMTRQLKVAKKEWIENKIEGQGISLQIWHLMPIVGEKEFEVRTALDARLLDLIGTLDELFALMQTVVDAERMTAAEMKSIRKQWITAIWHRVAVGMAGQINELIRKYGRTKEERAELGRANKSMVLIYRSMLPTREEWDRLMQTCLPDREKYTAIHSMRTEEEKKNGILLKKPVPLTRVEISQGSSLDEVRGYVEAPVGRIDIKED